MAISIWFYSKLLLGALAVLVGVIGTLYLVVQRSGRAALAFLPLVIVGGWLLAGGKIKLGSLEAQSDSFASLAQFVKDDQSIEPDKIIDFDNRGVTVWWKLLRYRIDARTLLRNICKEAGCPLDKADVGFEAQLKALEKLGLLDKKQYDMLDTIRINTYYAEWQAGDIPVSSEIEFVLANSPKALDDLRLLHRKIVREGRK